jgi:hypothetical protein
MKSVRWAPLPPAGGWTTLEAVDNILHPSAWEFYGSVTDYLLLRHVMRRPDLCFSGRPAPGARRRRVPRGLYDSSAVFALDVVAGVLEISGRPGVPLTRLVDVRIEGGESVVRARKRPSGRDYREDDAALVEDMHRGIERGDYRNATDAARMLAKLAPGHGTEQSKATRLIGRYTELLRRGQD